MLLNTSGVAGAVAGVRYRGVAGPCRAGAQLYSLTAVARQGCPATAPFTTMHRGRRVRAGGGRAFGIRPSQARTG